MAFTLQAIQGSTTLTLTSAPYSLLRATGMGGAAVRRVTTQGPSQHGDTDKGYRLLPRQFELQIGIKADTDALLDGYRDDLTAMFKPLTDTPVQLRVTRDDGEVRALDCYLRDEIGIALVPALRAGHYHRVTLPLVAPEPAYYSGAPGTATVTGISTLDPEWYLAGGVIDASHVLMQGGTPGTNSAWAYTGTIDGTVQSWSLAVRAEYLTPAGSVAYMLRSLSGGRQPKFYRQTDTGGFWAGTPLYRFANDQVVFGGSMVAGTQNYVYINNHALGDGARTWELSPGNSTTTDGYDSIVGTDMRWRTDGWTSAILLYALYDVRLNSAQRSALRAYMQGTVGAASQAISLPYAGDLPEYPVITLTGPLSSPSIINTSTGDKLDFGTIVIGAGTSYVIDTRYGVKTVTAGTVNKRGELTADSDLSAWSLVPDPIAAGGTNIITVNGFGAGSATQVNIVYYNRFASF